MQNPANHESWIVDAVHHIRLLLALFICLPVIWCAVTLLILYNCIIRCYVVLLSFMLVSALICLLLSETLETLGYEERLMCAMIALKYMFILQR